MASLMTGPLSANTGHSRTTWRTGDFDPLRSFPISPERAENTRKLPKALRAEGAICIAGDNPVLSGRFNVAIEQVAGQDIGEGRGWRADNLRVTQTAGVLAGEEICRWLAGQVRRPEKVGYPPSD